MEKRRVITAKESLVARADREAATLKFSCAQCQSWCSCDDSSNFKKCGKCGQTRYCSAACQQTHWELHKSDCVKRGFDRWNPTAAELFEVMVAQSHEGCEGLALAAGSRRNRDHTACMFIAVYPGNEWRLAYRDKTASIYVMYYKMPNTRHAILNPLPTGDHRCVELITTVVHRTAVTEPYTRLATTDAAGHCIMCPNGNGKAIYAMLPCKHLCVCSKCVGFVIRKRKCPVHSCGRCVQEVVIVAPSCPPER